ncbi:GATA transcription factor 5-like [Asparagus officinalis]|uniref:GATA transcription factor 5-like n=1 Tax=Asparagus officinalis TaxID=4686 RepID=UPI00098E4850|nr:GATA transcription factor 5-like [Asparagus officinalis]
MDVHSNAAVSGNVVDDFLSFDNMEGGGGVSLEWLSVFVEDCLNGGFPTPAPTTATHQTASPVDSQHESPKPTQATKDPTPVPSKTRTKRRKINTNQTNSLHSFHVSLSSSDPPPLLPQAYWLADSELIFPKKETENNKSPSPQLKPQGQEVKAQVLAQDESQGPRRCTHCLSYKTPQWRAGPLGPKTLCNACGVRFKSGRLLPEYRPAKSPTFESFKHSNSHKKVLEMRMATVFSSQAD